ncbi:Bergaptol o-methyltransferase [Thalictrum thalictroides]|uniref:Bergaptol o-methyltransferase n=1 Tax=Thalictrum thalictroides TaxID=46969 RepID=A0A7J6VHB9_THATH|nr:Bergaptol o-methyltransferase [Thalictrum thalictroides]
MDSIANHQKLANEEENYLLVMELVQAPILPMVIRVAVELGVFDTIAKHGSGSQMSSKSIVFHLPTQNPNAANLLDRILRLLCSYNILTSSMVTRNDGHVERLYGLAPLCKFFLKDEDGFSLYTDILMFQEKAVMDGWGHLKDAILEGGTPFNNAHGMNVFEYAERDARFYQVMTAGMFNHTAIIMKKILETYTGFENLREIVDVGGGVGTSIGLITSKYPTIKGINFDLPHVVAHAPSYPGVKHVGGNMFESIPSCETIFMKWILHDWSDEVVVDLLKNCYKALPDQGKVIVMDVILPAAIETNSTAKCAFLSDLLMMLGSEDGKERTEEEFFALAKEAGFVSAKKVCCVYNCWVMEFYKAQKN